MSEAEVDSSQTVAAVTEPLEKPAVESAEAPATKKPLIQRLYFVR